MMEYGANAALIKAEITCLNKENIFGMKSEKELSEMNEANPSMFRFDICLYCSSYAFPRYRQGENKRIKLNE
jgi:hypothetical protein